MGSSTAVSTDTARDIDSGRSVVASPHLFIAFETRRLLAGSARVSLRNTSFVELVKTDGAREVHRESGTLTVRIPDPTMSRAHAHLVHAGGAWTITDVGSKNGTFVNGRPVPVKTVVTLQDGDVIEVSRTFLIFRDGVPTGNDERPTAGFAEVVPQVPGLSTVLPWLRRAFQPVADVAASALPIVILGASGTGKEVMARSIHELSKRRREFAAVNCGAIAPNLVESELFGYVKGAFSGALHDRPGIIRSADGGTLLLDEIGELPLDNQVKLLRVLQEGEVHPVGAPRPVRVDVRFIAATNRDLSALVAEGRFRQDLYARLAAEVIHLPTLRERREDIGLLIAALLPRVAGSSAANVALTRAAARCILAYDWPTNIRELEQALRVAVTKAKGRPIEPDDLPVTVRAATIERSTSSSSDGDAQADADLRERMEGLLRKHEGNVAAIARELGVQRNTVMRWVARAGLAAARYRRGGVRPK